MPLYVCPVAYVLQVQMKLLKDVLVQTRDRNHESECLQCMSRSIFCFWGHIRNDILRRGRMGMVQTYRECLIHALYVIYMLV